MPSTQVEAVVPKLYNVYNSKDTMQRELTVFTASMQVTAQCQQRLQMVVLAAVFMRAGTALLWKWQRSLLEVAGKQAQTGSGCCQVNNSSMYPQLLQGLRRLADIL